MLHCLMIATDLLDVTPSNLLPYHNITLCVIQVHEFGFDRLHPAITNLVL